VSIKTILDTALTVVLVSCAATITIVYARREFGHKQESVDWGSPTKLRDWKDLQVGSKIVGPPEAPVTFVVFSDFQCPFCARIARYLHRKRLQDSASIRMVFRNFPIQALHPFARAAALAAECSAAQGRFIQLHDLLFSRPDSIGLWSWDVVANRIGLKNPKLLAKCMQSDAVAASFVADSLAGVQLGVSGTPTIVINEWRLRSGAPPDSVLDQLISKELKRARR
jgi:protein-disulfide isomerase